MSKKNLDKLFQEKFKDFSEIPDEKVWENISDSLDKKNRRRVIPIWWKLGGIAATLAILIYAINPFADTTEDNPSVTDVEKPQDVDPGTSKDEVEKILEIQGTEESVAASDSKDELESDESSNDDIEENQIPIKVRKKKNDEGKGLSPKKQEIRLVQNPSKKNIPENEAVVENNTIKEVPQNEQEAVAVLEKNETRGETQEKNEAIVKTASRKSLGEALEKEENEGIAQTEEEIPKNLEESTEKKSIFDVIENQEEAEIAENKNGRWSVGANVAPVYFNSFGEGSPIHSAFVPNSKSGDINMSYGLSVGYALSKKLSIRSGINKVDYGYDTNEIEFTSALTASNALTDRSTGQIDNISYTAQSQNLVVTSKVGAAALPQKQGFSSDVAGKSTARDGVMAQQFGYVEVPVELDYALVNKRFGINLIGGVSSLFLVDNSVSLSSGDLTTEMGEANNLNSVNFSGNIGLGVNYKFTPKVRLNIEPVFKYQLNTFSNTQGTFQPFSVGVYSGLSFRF